MTYKKIVTVTKFKIFTGCKGLINSDEHINLWLYDHPSVEIVNFQFNSNMDICIMYKETTYYDDV